MTLLAAGCAKETDCSVSAGEGVVFTGSLSEDTKAVLKPGTATSKVEWTAGDKVSVFAGASHYEYKADEAGATSTLSPVGASSLADEYIAVYPYDATATLSNGTVTTTLPAEQTAVLESFSHHLAVAHSTTLTLAFKNVCALLCVDIAETDVTKVVFSGNQNEAVAGKINISSSGAWTAVEPAKSASLVAESGKTLQLGKYYLAILPQEYAAGVTVTAYCKDGSTIVKNVSEKVSVAASGMIGGKISKGTWTVTSYSLPAYNPEDIVLAADGNFWITTRATVHGIWYYDLEAEIFTPIAVSDENSAAYNALTPSTFPWGAGFDENGVLYYAAKGAAKIFSCDATGKVTQYVVNDADLKNIMKVMPDGKGNLYALVRGGGNGLGYVAKIKDNAIAQKWDLTRLLYEFMCFSYDKTKIFVFPNSSGDIQMIDLATGTMTKVAGTGTQHSSASNYTDGTPGNPFTATLHQCEGAVCDANGTIYFTDSAKGKTIRMFTPDANGDYSKGTIKTIVGNPYDNSILPYPNGIALAADGQTLYVVDNTGKLFKIARE